MRFGKAFMPMFIKRLAAMEFGIGESFIHGPEGLAGWGSDKPSAFERTRVLDPEARPEAVAEILKRVKMRFPALANIEVAETWGGYVDFTPDAVPVISAVAGMQRAVAQQRCRLQQQILERELARCNAALLIPVRAAPCKVEHNRIAMRPPASQQCGGCAIVGGERLEFGGERLHVVLRNRPPIQRRRQLRPE